MIDSSMLPDFIDETSEHLEFLEADLLKIESDPENRDLINDIFRSIHSIKGAAELVGLEKISSLTHRLENILEKIRRNELFLNKEIVDILIAAKDRISRISENLSATNEENADIDDLIQSMNGLNEEVNTAVDVVDVEEEEDEPEREAALPETDKLPDKENDPIHHETYDEEYDQELFDIFLQQLEENLTNICSHMDEIENTEDRFELLEQCIEDIQCLRSSSNYMGYEKPTQIYEDWISEISKYQDNLSMGEPSLEISEFIKSCEKKYLTSIIELFPQVARVMEDQKTAGDTQQDMDADRDDQEKAVASSHPSPLENLYDRLHDAYDTTVSTQELPSGEFTPEEINDILFTDEDAQYEGSLPGDLAREHPSNEKTGPPHDDDMGELLFTDTRDTETGMTAEKDRARIDSEPKTKKPKGLPGPQKAEQQKPSQTKDRMVKQSLRVDAKKIDSLMNQVGELVVNRAWFTQVFTEMRKLQQYLKESDKLDQKEMKQVRNLTFKFSEATVALGRVANELQEGVMKIRMLPISQLFNRYPRLVRDLVSGKDKKVDLEIRGEETELDKMILEELSDPLIHIIRNAVDHGIESTAERNMKNKPEAGTIILEAYHESNHIVIEITDDGKGIDIHYLKQKALEKSFFSKEEVDRMNIGDLMRIIMVPGFSTADHVTHTSGRGVGMDVVKKNIEKLNGTIEIDSDMKSGTKFRIKIPLTLAIIPALLVRVGDDFFTIPLATVEETLRIFESETSTIEGMEVIHLRNRTMPIVRLSEIFGITPKSKEPDKSFVVIVTTGLQQIGLVVDELMGQEEVVIKPLVEYLQEESGFSGATIIGDGKISLILDIYELVKMTIGKQAEKHKQQAMLAAAMAEPHEAGDLNLSTLH